MAQQIKWQVGTVVETRQETPRAKSLIIDLPNWTPHLAGQHVDVRLTAEDGYQAQLSYSIASPPEDRYLTLTVERIDDGEVSPYLTDELRVGDRVELRGPVGGYFVWEASKEKHSGPALFLAAGGSGVAPLMAMIRHRANSGNKAPAKLLYSSRSYEDIIYREELDRLSADDTSLHVVHTLTRRQPQNWTSYARRIDLAMVREVAWPSTEKTLAYTCGPTPFVEAVANYLLELGYEPGRIKTERFGPTGG
jgi:ferredoxin-NADP reductase